MGINMSNIINKFIKTRSVNPENLKSISDGLPFAKKNAQNYETPNNPIVTSGGVNDWDAPGSGLHAPKLYHDNSWDESWRTYYMGVDSNGKYGIGFASTSDPTGEWTKHPSNPIMTDTESFEDSDFGVNILSIAHVKDTGDTGYVGFYGYRNLDGRLTSGRAVSRDGINFSDRTPCVFDEKLDSYPTKQITGVIWEPENNRFIAVLHVSNKTTPLIGAVASSEDGIHWKTLSILNGSPSYGDSTYAEPFDAFGISKTGSTYIVFAHKWDNIDLGAGNKPYKLGYYAVSTDLENWYISDTPYGLPQGNRDLGRYGSWLQAYDSWWGVHTVNYPLDVALIRMPITGPDYVYILDGETIENGDTSSGNLIVPDKNTRKLSITTQVKYGSVTGEVKIKIVPHFTPSNVQYYGVPVSEPIEYTLSQTAPGEYARDFITIHDLPDKFKIEIENQSGGTITETTIRMVFQE